MVIFSRIRLFSFFRFRIRVTKPLPFRIPDLGTIFRFLIIRVNEASTSSCNRSVNKMTSTKVCTGTIFVVTSFSEGVMSWTNLAQSLFLSSLVCLVHSPVSMVCRIPQFDPINWVNFALNFLLQLYTNFYYFLFTQFFLVSQWLI